MFKTLEPKIIILSDLIFGRRVNWEGENGWQKDDLICN